MLLDRYSGEHSSASSPAVGHFETAVLAVAEHRPGAVDALDRALAADPDLIAAHALGGFAAVLLARPEFDAQIRVSLEAAKAASRRRRATESERALVVALERAANGWLLEAAVQLEARLASEPHDLLALKLAHTLRFMGGDLPGMLRTTSDVVAAFDDDAEASGFVLGCHAFALEEAGCFDEAERFGRQAVEREPHDAWGLHAVSHVHEMQGRTKEGIFWLESTRDRWTGCNNFAGHVAWHLALFCAEAGEFDRALAIYDHNVRATPSEDFRDVANASSLLWRLGQVGVDVGDRWDDLVEIARRRAGETRLLFATLHHLLSLLARGERIEAARLLAEVMRCAAADDTGQSAVGREVAVDLARAMIGVPDAGETVDLVRTARALPRIGGSNAQRDVFVRTLAMAAANSGDAIAFTQIMMLRRQNRTADKFAQFAQACRDAAARRTGRKAYV